MNELQNSSNLLSRLTFEELYDAYATDIIRTAFFYLKDKQKAEDVCQETFIKMITKNPKLEKGKEKTWLLKVAINLCKDMLKSAWFKRTDLGDDYFENLIAPTEEQSSQEENLLHAITLLPPKFKDVVLLHYFQGYGVAEISKILSISLGTVSSRLSRARQKLQIELEKMANEQ